MNKTSIAKAAYRLNAQIWKDRHALWGDSPPEDPIRMLDPACAAQIFGLKYEEWDNLGQFGNGTQRFEVAGVFDRNDRAVRISKQFPLMEQRFTGAHELGHFELHPQTVAHRDRPVPGLSTKTGSRPRIEAEADYFAACFLIPPNLLASHFEARFLLSPLPINDTVAFHLCPADPGSLLGTHSNRDISVALASCHTFNGQSFHSLADTFRVSVTTMAIRLEELGLFKV